MKSRLASKSMNRFFMEVANNKLLTLRAILTGWTLWLITTTTQWHDVLMSYLGLSGKAIRLIWPGWSSHRWVYAVVPALPRLLYAWVIGLPVGRSHPAAA